MNIKGLTAAAVAASMLFGAASAGELADACTAAMEAEGRDASGCQCLEDALGGDEALIAEFFELGEIADPAERYASASDGAKAAMDECTR
ncbi:MAG: hypothetical protein AAGJ87_12455 [Pseudomonadota bacterium]